MNHKVLFYFHLLGFAAYLGAGFAQQRLMRSSARAGLAPAARDDRERIAADVVTKIELPALVVQVVTGVLFLASSSAWLTFGWMHAKLGCVVALLGLSHAEMFNARAIVKLRAAKGDAAADEIASRKARHVAFGAAGTLALVTILACVTYGLG